MASPPAHWSSVSAPPGWVFRKSVTSYTLPQIASQHESGVPCDASSEGETDFCCTTTCSTSAGAGAVCVSFAPSVAVVVCLYSFAPPPTRAQHAPSPGVHEPALS